MDSTQLNDVLASKIEELNELSVTSEKFKDATNAVCNLAETQAKIESHSTERKLKWWQVLLGVVGCATPFVMSAWDKSHYDRELNKILEYEKTGGIISSGGKSVLSGLKIGKK